MKEHHLNLSDKPLYPTNPIPAMKTVGKPAAAAASPITTIPMPPIMPIPTPTTIAGIIEVESQEGVHSKNKRHNDGEPFMHIKINTGTEVALKKIFEVNGHNYLFTSKCCMKCIEVKHKKMLRAYLISHGDAPGLRLWWKVWRATR